MSSKTKMFTVDPAILAEVSSPMRVWQGIPSIEVTKNGRIFVAFYSGGTSEQIGNYCCLICSDDGVNFSEPIAVAYPEEGYRCFDPSLWIDPLGRLWFIWSRHPAKEAFAIICDHPDAEKLTFGEEFRIGKGVMMNKPTVLSDGHWLFPLAVWESKPNALSNKEPAAFPTGACAYATSDFGKTFTMRGRAVIPQRSFDEHMFLENDDQSVSVFVRTSYGIGTAKSYDGGYSWSDGRPSGISGPCSRFHIRRLPSGRVILINHYEFTGRNNLCAFLSEDGGKSFPYHLMLDTRGAVSYPDMGIDGEGNLYIVYDRERGSYKEKLADALACAREILIAKIREEDIIAGKIVSEKSYLAHTVNKLGEYCGRDRNPYKETDKFTAAEFAEYAKQSGGDRNAAGYRESVLDAIFSSANTCCDKMHCVDCEKVDSLCDEYLSLGPGALENGKENELLTRIITEIRIASEREVTDNIIGTVISYINNNLASQITLSDLSDRFSTSRYYLAHLFKHETGLSMTEFCRERRITLAKQLLRGDQSITEIGGLCGFSTSSYFSETFKSVVGVTPSEYRKATKK